jgi:maltooligosyltrehalose synthase
VLRANTARRTNRRHASDGDSSALPAVERARDGEGLEDTSFYIFKRLASLNEVGGDPRCSAPTVGVFHRACRQRAAHWPTRCLPHRRQHDNKRSEDVRARIDVLSEMPGAWRLALRRWRQFNRRHRARSTARRRRRATTSISSTRRSSARGRSAR